MSPDSYMAALAADYFGDEIEAEEFCLSYLPTAEVLCQLSYHQLEKHPRLVPFNDQCHPESDRVFYDYSRDESWFIVNYEEFTS